MSNFSRLRSILEIGIPTYNRADQLENQLQNLNNLPFAEEKLSVLICDNSDSKTAIPYGKFTNLNIRYFHNQTNIGLEGNIKKLILNSKSEYLWIVSDDDEVRAENIPRLLEILKNSSFDYGLLVENFPQVQSGNFDYCWKSAIWLSCCIYKTEVFKELIQDFYPTNKTYPQVALCIFAFSKKLKFLALKNFLVVDRAIPKNYSASAASKVQILDLHYLDLQARSLENSEILRAEISNMVSSNMISYSIQAIFTYHLRSDYLAYFSKWVFSYRIELSRIKSILFSTSLLCLGLIDYRIARFFCLSLFIVHPGLNSGRFTKSDIKRNTRTVGTDAATYGYDPIISEKRDENSFFLNEHQD